MTTLSESLKNYTDRYKNISTIKTIEFPVYKLDGEPFKLDNILFDNGKPIDDLNVSEKTLGLRRLKSKQNLYSIKTVCFNFPELVKRLKGQDNWFIDSNGLVFKYVTTKRQKVASHKVDRVSPRGTHSVIYLEGVDYPFVVSSPPKLKYARVLYYKEVPWAILEFTREPKRPSTKKV